MNKLTEERLTILQLATMMAHKKLDECQYDMDELEQKQSIMKADGACFEEKEDIKNSIYYMNHCYDGWQKRIDLIRDWEKEIIR